MKKLICLGLILVTLLMSGCAPVANIKDGFYTAEMSSFSHGWKEYLCIMVKDNHIVYADFNAKTPSGYIKSWDNAYMENMSTVCGTYPTEYTRFYSSQIVHDHSIGDIDLICGATHSGDNFTKLSAAVLEQAQKGDSCTVVIE